MIMACSAASPTPDGKTSRRAFGDAERTIRLKAAPVFRHCMKHPSFKEPPPYESEGILASVKLPLSLCWLKLE
jgi:hypothetical protein